MSLCNRKIHKRAQVTIFIIAGIVLLFAIAAILYLSGKNKTSVESIQSESSDEFEANINDCLRQTTYNGLVVLGKQGGYLQVPQIISYQGTSYWYLNQANIQPTIDEMKFRLESYVDENLPKCIAFSDFEGQGYEIKRQKPITQIVFGKENVIANTQYEIETQKKTDFKKYGRFTTTLDVSFRRIFELSTSIITKQLQMDFKFSRPLDKLDLNNFKDLEASFSSDAAKNSIVYLISDKDAKEFGKKYEFTFASRFDKGDLKRTITLQNNSNVVQTVYPLVIYSQDRMAQLEILGGTTIAKDNMAVKEITVRQIYDAQAIAKSVPVALNSDGSFVNEDISWILRYPVYEFEPTGLRFSNNQKFRIYWDEDRFPHKGEMGLLLNEGDGWRPFKSEADYNKNCVVAQIPGFTEFTLVDCADQKTKTAVANAKSSGGVKCIALTVVSMGIGATFWWAGMSVFATLEASIASSAGFSLLTNPFFQKSGKNTVPFLPSCKQKVQISQEVKGGTGSCDPKEGSIDAEAGQIIQLKAVIKKCNFIKAMFCGSCSIKCTATYK